MVKDRNGNDLSKGLFVAVELDKPLLQGFIEQILEGGTPVVATSIAAFRQAPQAAPTEITIMCPVRISVHPDSSMVRNLMVLKQPEPPAATERTQ